MEHFNFMKNLFDANQLEFSVEEIQNLSNLSENEVNQQLTHLCNQKLLKKNNNMYSITEDGRVDFANSHSKQVMVRIVLFSFFMTFLLYIFAKFIV